MYSPRLTFSETLKAIEARLGPYPTDTVIRRLKYSLPIRPRIPASNRSDHITHDEDVVRLFGRPIASFIKIFGVARHVLRVI